MSELKQGDIVVTNKKYLEKAGTSFCAIVYAVRDDDVILLTPANGDARHNFLLNKEYLEVRS